MAAFNNKYAAMSIRDIAKVMNLSHGRVDQIYRSALKKLKRDTRAVNDLKALLYDLNKAKRDSGI
jgi:DNA-directed RNA polymerase sigma subunit (sigma70/sigma32)